jgi:hypothetical protein
MVSTNNEAMKEIPTPASKDETTTKEQWARWGSILLFAINAVGLGIFHFSTPTRNNDLPSSSSFFASDLPIQSTMDKVLFSALILMAFELVDFLTKSSGSAYSVFLGDDMWRRFVIHTTTYPVD